MTRRPARGHALSAGRPLLYTTLDGDTTMIELDTVNAAERELAAARNRARCVITDADRDPAPICRRHLDTMRELHDRLDRLRDEMDRREELIGGHLARIAGYREQLRVVLVSGARIKKLLRLIRETNRLDREKRIQVRKRFNEARMTSQHVAELRMFIRGFEHEVKRLETLPKKFAEEEAALLRSIEANERYWDEFVENRRDRDFLLPELLGRAEQLDRLLADMRADDNARRLLALAEEISSLEAELAGEGTT